MTDEVLTMVVFSSLYVGGNLSDAGGTAGGNLASWNGGPGPPLARSTRRCAAWR